MGSKDPKGNEKNSATTDSNVDAQNEESSVSEDSSDVLVEGNTEASVPSNQDGSVGASESNEADNSKDSLDQTQEPEENVEVEESVEESVEEPIVETVYLDDSKVGTTFANYPLSESVLKGLSNAGHQYLSRYQQVLLNSMTLGENKWFSINLASNRGVVIGAYLLDLALYKPDGVSAILCVAVPKIRQYLENDLLTLGQFTGVKILSIHEPLEEGFELDEVPNIIIAPIEELQKLKEKLDFSTVETLYFDEVEKTIRDSRDDFVDFVGQYPVPQVLLQSSYYSAELVSAVHQVLPEIHPTRIYKNYGSDLQCFAVSESESCSVDTVLTTTMLQRSVIIVDDQGLSTLTSQLQRNGWDVEGAIDDETVQSLLDSLRENRLQTVVMTQERFLQAQHVEFDVLIFMTSPSIEEVIECKRKYKRLATLVFLSPWVDESDSLTVQPISEFVAHRDRHGVVVDCLREGFFTKDEVDWTALVDDILQQTDGKQLLGEAVRVALEQKRSQQGYIRSHVYKLEKKDVFQRRNRRKSKR